MARAIVFAALICLMRSCHASQAPSEPPASPGGPPAEPLGLPFVAFLTRQRRAPPDVVCAATIVHHSFVLTAAGCFYSSTGKPISYQHQVLIADAYKSIKQLIPHPRYRLQSGSCDVGLIRLADRIAFGPRVSKIALARDNLPVFSVASTACRALSGKKTTVQAEPTHIVPRTRCSDARRFGRYTSGAALCARADRANDACAVDDGAPLFKEGQQFAVASWRYGDKVVFTKLVEVRWWIINTITEGSFGNYFADYPLYT